MTEQKTHTFPVREDMRFQNAAWIVERIVWGLLALVPLAALAGTFSHGPLSHKTAQAADSGLSLEYESFERMTVLSRFLFRIPARRGEEVRLHLSPSFQLTYEIQSIQPEPARSSAGAEGLELYFRPLNDDLTAVIWATPRQFGMLKLRAETDGPGSIEVPVFIYP
jgi:hypothetical protein